MAFTHAIAATLALAVGGMGFMRQAEPAASKTLSFSTLKQGQSIEVDYASSGCFHAERFNLTFTQGKGLRANVKSITTETMGDQRVDVTHELGNLVLSTKDAKGLDGLIAFYRSKPGDGCTTVDTVTLTHRHGNRVLSTEKFVDGSCSFDKEHLQIGVLVRRFPK